MADAFRFPDTPKPGPKNVHRATLFQMVGPSERQLTCAAYETEFGLELRYDDLMRSELFRGIDREERLAAAADAWHLALRSQQRRNQK